MDGNGEQEEVSADENLPTSDTAPAPVTGGEVCERMESMQLKDPSPCDNTSKAIDNYRKKIEHLETVVSKKQSVIEDLTLKYNETTMKLLQLEKANQQPMGEKATTTSPSNRHPGSDLCMSPPVTDTNLRTEIQIRDHQIAELQGFMKEYYDLVMKSNEEKEDLSRQLRHSMSLNKKLKLQADDLVEEKDRLYDKLSDFQSSLETVKKERDTLQETYFTGSSSSREPETNIEQLKTQIHELKAENEILKQEKDQSKQHVKEQEEKIEKLMLRCGRAEDDLKKIFVNKDSRHHQPSDENNDWRFRSLDEKDAKISELSALIEHQRNEIHELQLSLQSQKLSEESYFIKEQLKAFQDDYHAEREEKERILKAQQQLEETNEKLMKQLGYAQNYSADPTHYSPMPTARGHVHSRHYTPSQTRHINHNPNTPATHLPAPNYGNTIPPRGYPGAHHEQNTPYEYRPPLPSNHHHDVNRGGNHPEDMNRGHLRDPH